eukprot:5906749-Prymnesium_polylepis.1
MEAEHYDNFAILLVAPLGPGPNQYLSPTTGGARTSAQTSLITETTDRFQFYCVAPTGQCGNDQLIVYRGTQADPILLCALDNSYLGVAMSVGWFCPGAWGGWEQVTNCVNDDYYRSFSVHCRQG